MFFCIFGVAFWFKRYLTRLAANILGLISLFLWCDCPSENHRATSSTTKGAEFGRIVSELF